MSTDMQVIVKGSDAPNGLNELASQRLDKVRHFLGQIQTLEIEFSEDPEVERADRRHTVDVVLTTKAHVLRAQASASDPESAIDLVLDRIAQQVNRLKSRASQGWQSRDDESAEESINMDRVLARASALRMELGSVFDQPLGMSEECLSSRVLVRLLREGATDRELDHLESCPVCQQLAARLSIEPIPDPAEFIQAVLKIADGQKPEASTHVAVERQLLRAIVGVREYIYSEDGRTVRFFLDLIPAFPRDYFDVIDVDSLRVDGAVASGVVSVERALDQTGGEAPAFLQIKVEGELVKRVRDAMMHHRRIIDAVHIHGSFLKADLPQFSGTASVEFLGKSGPSS